MSQDVSRAETVIGRQDPPSRRRQYLQPAPQRGAPAGSAPEPREEDTVETLATLLAAVRALRRLEKDAAALPPVF